MKIDEDWYCVWVDVGLYNLLYQIDLNHATDKAQEGTDRARRASECMSWVSQQKRVKGLDIIHPNDVMIVNEEEDDENQVDLPSFRK